MAGGEEGARIWAGVRGKDEPHGGGEEGAGFGLVAREGWGCPRCLILDEPNGAGGEGRGG